MQTSCAIADRTCRIQEAAKNTESSRVTRLKDGLVATHRRPKTVTRDTADDRTILAESEIRNAQGKLCIRESELDDVMSDLRNSKVLIAKLQAAVADLGLQREIAADSLPRQISRPRTS
mgnify:CR=1 FL=1